MFGITFKLLILSVYLLLTNAEVDVAPEKENLTASVDGNGDASKALNESLDDHVEAQVGVDNSSIEENGGTLEIIEPSKEESKIEAEEKADDAMPSFDEWKKQKMSEKGIKSTGASSTSCTVPTKGAKVNARNYASYECGAKVMAANLEAQGMPRILNEQLDEYMLNPCTAKIWFIIELCESIQPTTIELANLELFSSLPKDFNVYGSDHYPSRDWTLLGSYMAEDARKLQTFELLSQTEFRKYLKFEMISSYGSEHYCPLSVVRVYGTSVVEEFDAIERQDENRKVALDEDELSLSEEPIGDEMSSTNLLGSAKEAVFSIMRKAALALSKSQDPEGSLDSSKVANFSLRPIDSVYYHHLFPIMEPLLSLCGDCTLPSASSNSYSRFERQICRYWKALLGTTGYDFLCYELRKEKGLRFKSTTEETTLKSTTNVQDATITTETINIRPTQVSSTEADNEVKTTTVLTDSSSLTSEDLPVESMEVPTSKKANDSEESVESEQFSDGTNFVNQTLPKENLDTLESGVPFEKSNVTQAPPAQGGLTNGGLPPTVGSQSKESVFIRMNNKIKALEMNLSLTSQYLEELSQRYRRQMDDMQHAFNKTIMRLNLTAKIVEENNADKEEKLRQLQRRLLETDEKVQLLVAEKETLHWQFVQVHMVLLVTEIVIMISILSLFERRMSAKIRDLIDSHCLVRHNNSQQTQTPRKRLADTLEDQENYLPAKTKRLEGDLLIVEPSIPILVDAPAKKKKKKKKPPPLVGSGSLYNYNLNEDTHLAGLHRSNSISTFNVNTEATYKSTSVKNDTKRPPSNNTSSASSSLTKLSEARQSSSSKGSTKSSEKFNWKKFIKFDKNK